MSGACVWKKWALLNVEMPQFPNFQNTVWETPSTKKRNLPCHWTISRTFWEHQQRDKTKSREVEIRETICSYVDARSVSTFYRISRFEAEKSTILRQGFHAHDTESVRHRCLRYSVLHYLGTVSPLKLLESVRDLSSARIGIGVGGRGFGE